MAHLDRDCPNCRSTRVWQSSAGWLRLVARVVRLYPLRCDVCLCRYWRFCWDPPPRAEKVQGYGRYGRAV